MRYDIYQIDAFTKEPFKGNPAAVVPFDAWPADEVMQNIALENNLAETAFFSPDGDNFGLRWFTPTVEMDLCGHATLATGYLIFEVLGTDKKILRFQTLSGELTVEKQGDQYVMDFPSRPASPFEAPAGLIEAIGAEPKEVLKANDYLLVFENESQVKAIKPDLAALKQVAPRGVIVSAPGDSSDFVSRFFAPAVGVDEDPVTGSTHTTLIPYWAERLGKKELFARQVSSRGGELFCELRGERVKIGGQATLYLKGEIYVETTEPRVASA
ncbi:MAG: PhzF family phenazine biosynthesis protein [Pyrinomonadaceae bacterium]